MSGVRIRAAVAEDLEEIVRLERGSEAPHWAVGEYEAILRGGGVPRCLLVAEVDEELVGFAVGKALRVMEEVVGELETVVVADSARRRGVGRSLCGAVLDWCGGKGQGLWSLR
jgi:ribosomal-protein-alanine N-acetyltransferase